MMFGLLTMATSRRPFPDNPQTAGKSEPVHPAPEFGSVVTTVCPLTIKVDQPRFKRTGAGSEHIGPLAAENRPDGLSAVTSLFDDSFDAESTLSQSIDLGVRFLM